MPLFDDDDVSLEVVTDFGGGRSLKIVLKDEARSIPTVRRLYNLYRQTDSVQRRITALQTEQERATPEQFAKLDKQIAEFQEKPDNFSLAVKLLHSVGSGWDYYPSREAEERGEPFEYSEENIMRLKPMLLMKVLENVNRALGLVEDIEESKKSEGSLPKPSTQTATEVGSSQTGSYS